MFKMLILLHQLCKACMFAIDILSRVLFHTNTPVSVESFYHGNTVDSLISRDVISGYLCEGNQSVCFSAVPEISFE